MSDTVLNLTHPPIIEAVLDIECDLPPGQQVKSLEETAKNLFQDHYPKFGMRPIHEHQIELKADDSPSLAVGPGIQALQFLHEDEKQLVRIRKQGFSFNRLAPYTRLDDYLPEIERIWHLYVNLASPVLVRSIRLRYINRILIPLCEGHVDLDKYLKAGPRLPDEDKLVLTGFLNQHTAVEVETGNQVNLVLTAQEREGDNLPIIFDNCVTSMDPVSPQDWTGILVRIGILRELKNRIFKETLTDACLDLFQKQ